MRWAWWNGGVRWHRPPMSPVTSSRRRRRSGDGGGGAGIDLGLIGRTNREALQSSSSGDPTTAPGSTRPAYRAHAGQVPWVVAHALRSSRGVTTVWQHLESRRSGPDRERVEGRVRTMLSGICHSSSNNDEAPTSRPGFEMCTSPDRSPSARSALTSRRRAAMDQPFG